MPTARRTQFCAEVLAKHALIVVLLCLLLVSLLTTASFAAPPAVFDVSSEGTKSCDIKTAGFFEGPKALPVSAKASTLSSQAASVQNSSSRTPSQRTTKKSVQ